MQRLFTALFSNCCLNSRHRRSIRLFNYKYLLYAFYRWFFAAIVTPLYCAAAGSNIVYTVGYISTQELDSPPPPTDFLAYFCLLKPISNDLIYRSFKFYDKNQPRTPTTSPPPRGEERR